MKDEKKCKSETPNREVSPITLLCRKQGNRICQPDEKQTVTLIHLTINDYWLRFLSKGTDTSKTVLYGAGADGRVALRNLRREQIPVAYFCDRDPQKDGQFIDGIEVLSPIRLVESGIDFKLILCISSDDFTQESILEGINKSIFDVLNLPPSERTVFCIRFPVLGFSTLQEFHQADLWYLSLAFDRVEQFDLNYSKQVRNMPISHKWNNGYLSIEDYKSRYHNFHNGIRFTLGSDNVGVRENTIYMLGDSRCYGQHVEDQHTSSSFLQGLVGKRYSVLNMGATIYTMDSYLCLLRSLPLKQGDVVTLSALLEFRTPKGKGFDAKYAAQMYAFYLKQMQDYCDKQKAVFLFYYIPYVHELTNPSLAEQYISALTIKPNPSSLQKSDMPHLDVPSIVNKFEIHLLERTRLFRLLQAFRVRALDLTGYLSRPHRFGETYIDRRHLSPNGYAAVAHRIYEVLCDLDEAAQESKKLEEICKKHEKNVRQEMLSIYDCKAFDDYLRYLEHFYRPEAKKAGCIVMNCNPFTNGHRYLIEYAASQVDVLYIFVLQEEQSVFPFSDRINLVREGTADIKNVVVLESGQFIISSITFPEYFHKDAAPNQVDCADDLYLFCERIAPALNIKIRFAGEEPFCRVTRQYNEQMQLLLPEYGIEFDTIQRKTFDGQAISASHIRSLIKEGDLKKIRPMVPDATYAYVQNHWETLMCKI